MAGVGDNECVVCNNDTSFMIIGQIPNLLAPLFVLQKEREKKKKRKRKRENKKEKGKKKRGVSGAMDCPGVPEVSPCQRGWLPQHLPEGLLVLGKDSPMDWRLL